MDKDWFRVLWFGMLVVCTMSVIYIGTSVDRIEKHQNDHINMTYQQMDKIDVSLNIMKDSIAKLVPVAEKVKLYDLGDFRVTYYCNNCDKCGTHNITSNGTTLNAKMKSVAVDTSIIPKGSRLLINGVEYIANDTGGAINGHDIDIMVWNTPHEVVKAMGDPHYEVYMIIER